MRPAVLFVQLVEKYLVTDRALDITIESPAKILEMKNIIRINSEYQSG
ncbi:MAG: hypothetical protein R2727_10840 [Bacteroidales bacterium]